MVNQHFTNTINFFCTAATNDGSAYRSIFSHNVAYAATFFFCTQVSFAIHNKRDHHATRDPILWWVNVSYGGDMSMTWFLCIHNKHKFSLQYIINTPLLLTYLRYFYSDLYIKEILPLLFTIPYRTLFFG